MTKAKNEVKPDVAINELRKANNFKLVHAKGRAITHSKLEDERFELGFEDTVKLRRKVEML